MSLNPVIYEDNVTVIHAANLNSIQDAILANESAIAGKVSASDYNPTTKTSAMTQEVGKDGNGKLWTEPSSGGAGLIIKGYYPTLQSLIANVPNPSLGDAYGVGSAAPYTIYIWDGFVWVDNGTIKGEKGDPGEDGEDGFAPAVTITPITGGHRVNITDATHPSGQDFDVMDGTGNVDSVNGQTGTVVLDGADINVDDTAATPQTIKAKIASIDNINTQQSSDIVALQNVVPAQYSTTTQYYVGNACIYNGYMYICHIQPSVGAFNSACWTQVRIGSLASLSYTVVATW